MKDYKHYDLPPPGSEAAKMWPTAEELEKFEAEAMTDPKIRRLSELTDLSLERRLTPEERAESRVLVGPPDDFKLGLIRDTFAVDSKDPLDEEDEGK